MKQSRMFIFEGDAFDLAYVTCVSRETDTVFVYVLDHREYEYDFDSEATAQSRQTEFIRAWRDYLHAEQNESQPTSS